MPNRSILLVDGNPVDLDLIIRAFSRNKVRNPIQVARDAQEISALIDRWETGDTPPALILLDLDLPKVSGLEILRRLKSHRRFKPIPVVMLTDSINGRDIKAAYDLGVNSYIVKPLDFGRLIESIAQIAVYWCLHNTPPIRA